jgi:type IV pilus assembly protein PilW
MTAVRITMYRSPNSRAEADEGSRLSVFPNAVQQMLASRSRGFSLIELMVGIVISLIGTLAIMAAFALFEGQKRTTTAGDDAQQNGSYSLYALERQLRTGGSGLVQGNSYGIWGCAISARTAGGQQLPPNSAQPAPFAAWPITTRAMSVLISSGGTNAGGAVQPDIIGVISGNPTARVFKAPVSSTPDNATVVLTNSFGIYQSDYLLGILSDGTCGLAQTQTAPDATNTVTLNAGNSPTTGLQTATNVFDMGQNPILSLYGVDPTTNSLVMWDLLRRPVNGQPTTVPTPIADGIVQLKALYGVHTVNTDADPNTIDAWVQPTGVWSIATLNASTTSASTAMGEIKAIRVAVIAQSKVPERSSDYVGPLTLTLFPDLAPALRYTITLQTQYRYKVYDTTIPIRNGMITRYF